jgi:hypothetical protein
MQARALIGCFFPHTLVMSSSSPRRSPARSSPARSSPARAARGSSQPVSDDVGAGGGDDAPGRASARTAALNAAAMMAAASSSSSPRPRSPQRSQSQSQSQSQTQSSPERPAPAAAAAARGGRTPASAAGRRPATSSGSCRALVLSFFPRGVTDRRGGTDVGTGCMQTCRHHYRTHRRRPCRARTRPVAAVVLARRGVLVPARRRPARALAEQQQQQRRRHPTTRWMTAAAAHRQARARWRRPPRAHLAPQAHPAPPAASGTAACPHADSFGKVLTLRPRERLPGEPGGRRRTGAATLAVVALARQATTR